MDYEHIKNIVKNIDEDYIVHFSECFEGDVITIASKDFTRLCLTVIYPENIVYISWLSIDKECRKSGLGTILLKDIETFFRTLGKRKLRLLVEIGSWKYEWYIQMGFKYLSDFDKTWCYMTKEINDYELT